MIAGVFAGLVGSRLGASSLPVLGVLATVIAGGMFAGLFADQERRWRRSGESEPTLFLPDGQPAVQVRGLVSAYNRHLPCQSGDHLMTQKCPATSSTRPSWNSSYELSDNGPAPGAQDAGEVALEQGSAGALHRDVGP